MKVEKLCSPGHCLGMLNENMRTDILRKVHEGIYFEKEQHANQSPLEMLISSIDATLAEYTDNNLVEQIARNPYYPFDPDADYQHDIELLTFQCRELKKILKDICDY